MEPVVLEEEMEVRVHCGIHGRVAVQLAEITRDHGVDLLLSCGERQVRCDSILELLSLALVQGSVISVRAEGKQAAAALAGVRRILMEEEA